MSFETAKFYTCDPTEEGYESETPAEAIEAFLERWQEPGVDTEAMIRERGPITVYAYHPESVSVDWMDNVADSMFEKLEEEFNDFFGNPNGDHDAVREIDKTRLLGEVQGIVADYCTVAEVWSCEKVGERDYSADEVLVLMRSFRPDWFES